MTKNNPITYKKYYRILSLLSIVLVTLGSYVRATGAGMSCPDWPLCYNMIIPPMHEGVFQEWAHRVLAGCLAILVVLLFIGSYKHRKENAKAFYFHTYLLCLVIIQAFFGGLTVWLNVNAFIVTSHLILGTLFLQSLLSASFNVSSVEINKSSSIKFCAWLFFLLTFLQISIGGFVASSGASLACLDFPFCQGALIPNNATGQQLVQILHRLLGFSILIACFICFVQSFIATSSKGLRGHIGGVLFVIIFQIILGWGIVAMRLPIPMAVTHAFIAQLILSGAWFIVRRL